MKTKLKTILSAIALAVITIWWQQVYAFITSEKVYLQNSISNALIQQEELAQANSILREFLPERKVAYEKAKKELKQTERNIHANSTQWDFLTVQIQNAEFRLSVITEADKNLWNLKK